MTCIAGIAQDGQVWMGGDSLGSRSGTKVLLAEGKLAENGEFLIGHCGPARYGNLSRHVFSPPALSPDADLDAYMANQFADAWRECLKASGMICKGEDDEEVQSGMLLVGVRGRLYEVDGHFTAIRSLDGYSAIGSADNIALGALYATKGMPPRERIMLALKAAEKWDDGVASPFHVKCNGESNAKKKSKKR